MPARDIGITERSQLWILGQESLWHWNLVSKRVKQIKLPTSRPLKHLHISDSVVVSDDINLFSITPDPLKVLSFPLPDKTKGSSMGIVSYGSQTFWMRTDGIYVIGEGNKNLVKIHSHSFSPHAATLYQYMPQHQTLWFVQKTALFRFPYNGKMKLVANLQDPILHTQVFNDELYALTPNAILRISAEGKLLQTVPVEGKRQIALASFEPEAHTFLFHDGLLELLVPGTQNSVHYSLDLPVSQASRMAIRGSFLVLILGGNPRAFQLSSGRPS